MNVGSDDRRRRMHVASGPLSGLTTLLVEDEPAASHAIRVALEQLGAIVVEVASGQGATAIADLRRIDVILAGVHVRGRDGEMLAREIAARRPGTPAVFMSSAPLREHIAAGWLRAGDRMLELPCGAASLGRALLDAIAGAHATTAGRRPHLLVIESNAAARAAMCEGLAEMGYDTVGLASAALAAEIIARERIDVAIVEHSPPWTDGDLVVARLREPWPALRAVLVSAVPLDQVASIAQSRAHSRGLSKPTSLDALADAVGELLTAATA